MRLPSKIIALRCSIFKIQSLLIEIKQKSSLDNEKLALRGASDYGFQGSSQKTLKESIYYLTCVVVWKPTWSVKTQIWKAQQWVWPLV